MSIPNLPVNFKDDILAASNPKRKYQQTFNSDGSVSLEDVTVYSQTGSEFGASQVNQTNKAINNIYSERILDLDELELVTEPGFFVDAQAAKEAYDTLNSKTPKFVGQAGYNGSVSIANIPAGTELLIVAECAISAGSRSSFSWSVIKQKSGTKHYMDGFAYSQNYRGAVGITVTPDSVSFRDDWTQFLDSSTPISKSSNSILVYLK